MTATVKKAVTSIPADAWRAARGSASRVRGREGAPPRGVGPDLDEPRLHNALGISRPRRCPTSPRSSNPQSSTEHAIEDLDGKKGENDPDESPRRNID